MSGESRRGNAGSDEGEGGVVVEGSEGGGAAGGGVGDAEEGVGIRIGDAVGADAGDEVGDESTGIIGVGNIEGDRVEGGVAGGIQHRSIVDNLDRGDFIRQTERR